MNSASVLAFLADAILAKPTHRPLRVAIDGRPGAGKTTLADALADRLEASGRSCLRASLDDFHRPGHAQRETTSRTPAEYIREAYDYAKLRELLLDPTGPRGDRRCRLDYWNSHDDQPFPEDWIDVERDAVVIVDGVFLHTPELREAWDYGVWLDVDWQNTMRRIAHRDGTRGSPADLLREAYQTGWVPRHLWYEQTLHPRERVDVVIDNSDVEHPNVVRAPRPQRMVP